ncbi:retrovirus-related pol polyprotein from transposon TNT 1-94 [Tanacetum coccineum]
MVLTNIPFNGSNFHGWNRNVKMALGAKLKLGFIDGSCPKPGVEGVDLQRWIRCDYMVTCWILNSMVTELSDAFLYAQSACELWKEIAERYGQSNGPLIYQLERELSKITQVLLRDSNSKLIHFLIKLNDDYESQIEKQKQVTNHSFEPTAFFANLNNKGANNGRKDNSGSRNDGKHDGKRFCTGCNQEGHTVDQCFEKIGYPDWYKGKKEKKQGRMVANVSLGFDYHFSAVTPFDMGYENETRNSTGVDVDQRLVAADPTTKQIVAVGKGSKCLYICKPTIDPIAFSTSLSEFQSSHLKSLPSISLFADSFSNNVSKNVLDTHFHKQPRVVRSDNGTEIVNKTCAEFFQKHGIINQKPMAYTPQQNGRVERKHRHLLDTARALRLQANFPLQFWGDCILNATYLINKMPVKIFDWKTPYERLYGKPPTYDHLIVIGCLCYAANDKPQKDKFENRRVKSVLIGYPVNQRGYKLYNWETKEIFLSRDVVFEEHVFPFKQPPSNLPDQPCPAYPVFETHLLEETAVSNTPLHDTTPIVHLVHTELAMKDITNPLPRDPIPSTSTSIPIRRFARNAAKPVWLKDFITPAKANSVSTNPTVQHEGWVKAMEAEFAALERNETWTHTSLPTGHKPITSKWVFKIKYKPDGIVD